jgi:hypothetical protein
MRITLEQIDLQELAVHNTVLQLGEYELELDVGTGTLTGSLVIGLYHHPVERAEGESWHEPAPSLLVNLVAPATVTRIVIECLGDEPPVVTWDVPEPTPVGLSVVDLLGRKLSDLTVGQKRFLIEQWNQGNTYCYPTSDNPRIKKRLNNLAEMGLGETRRVDDAGGVWLDWGPGGYGGKLDPETIQEWNMLSTMTFRLADDCYFKE